jgi:hypothetical protein
MSEVWIEAARQQVHVFCNHGAVLWKVDYQGWSTLRSKEYGSAADNAKGAVASTGAACGCVAGRRTVSAGAACCGALGDGSCHGARRLAGWHLRARRTAACGVVFVGAFGFDGRRLGRSRFGKTSFDNLGEFR